MPLIIPGIYPMLVVIGRPTPRGLGSHRVLRAKLQKVPQLLKKNSNHTTTPSKLPYGKLLYTYITESDPVCTHCHSRCRDFIYVDIDTMFFRILVSRVCCIKVQTQKYTELWTLWWFLDWNSWVCTSLYLYFVFFDLGPGNLPCLQQTLPAFKGHKTWMWEGENSKPRKEYGQRPQNFNVCSWGEGAGCTNHKITAQIYC